MGFRFYCLIIAVLLLCGCPKPDSAGSTSDNIKAPAGSDPAFTEDHILASLQSEELDVRNFALLAINNFGLTGYHDQILELAPTDPVAAITAATVHGDITPASDFFITAPPRVRIETILGVVYGLECADRVPAALWVDLISRVPEDEFDPLLWGIAQLDVEPGGPIKRSDELIAALENRYVEAEEAGETYRMGALDALLGGDANHELNWAAYTAYVPESNWNGVQWVALLRWADPATWDDIIMLRGLHDRIRYQLARAVALVGPKGVKLPGGIGPWAGIDADIEYRINQFTSGSTESIELPELAVLLDEVETLSTEGAADITAQLNQRAYSDVLAVLDYSLIHGEPGVLTQIVDALGTLPSEVRTAVMATILRRKPQALNGDNLDKVIALEDKEVAYFLLTGWYSEPQVQNSLVPKTIRLYTGSGNLVVAYAYQRWLESQEDSSSV